MASKKTRKRAKKGKGKGKGGKRRPTPGRRKAAPKRGPARTKARGRARPRKARAGGKRKRPRAPGGRRAAPAVDLHAVGEICHDVANIATAMRAYLELLETQGTFEARQQYYIDRTKAQVDQMVRTVQDLRARLPTR